MSIMVTTHIASKRRDARSAGNTIQADRRSMVTERSTVTGHSVVTERSVVTEHSAVRPQADRRSMVTERSTVTGRSVVRPHVERSVVMLSADQCRVVMMAYPSATIPSDRRSVMRPLVQRSTAEETRTSSECLGEMRQTVLSDNDRVSVTVKSRISPRCSTRPRTRNTTLRMVIPASVGASHVSDMVRPSVLEKVLLLNLDTVLYEKLPILFRKCHTAVVLLLPGDIPNYRGFITQALGKPGILFGPAVEKREMGVGLEPLASGDFEFLDELGHRQCCRQGHKKMYMFGHATDTIKMSAFVLGKAEHVGVELAFVILHDGRDATVCAEDNVIVSLCVTHNFVHSFCYYFVYCVMVTERCSDYCVGRISPRCFFRPHLPYHSSGELSHLSDMLEGRDPSAITTLRGSAAGMVLPAPIGASHASGMTRPVIASGRGHRRHDTIIRLISRSSPPADSYTPHIASERRDARSAGNTIQAKRSVVTEHSVVRLPADRRSMVTQRSVVTTQCSIVTIPQTPRICKQ